jgi:hypothetical protein
LSVCDLSNFDLTLLVENVAQDSIVRGHEKISPGCDQERTAGTPDAGIHHYNVNGTVGERRITGFQDVGSLLNGMWGDVVGKIDNCSLRVNREDDPLHAPHEIVPIAKICQKRDNGSR